MISIVMPILIFNKFLAKMTMACINNLREFIPEDELQFVIVHNQSQLYSGEITSELTKQDIYLPQPDINLRLGKCLNLGIEKADSDLILIMANDVMVHHDFYQPLRD